MLIITGMSNEETKNELTIYAILPRNVTTFYRQELASSFQVQKNCKSERIQNETLRVAVSL